MYPKVVLNKGKENAVQGGHPWVFSGAVADCGAGVEDGGLVTVVDSGNRFLGHGYYNSRSAIRVRILSREKERSIDGEFWSSRIGRAISWRERVMGSFPAAEAETDAFRLVNGEGDFLPGLVVDRYGSCLVVQFHTLGMDRRKEEILTALESVPGIEAIVERSDLAVRRKEGLEATPPSMLSGNLPADGLVVRENGIRYRVDPLAGQKTGLYLDQRENRGLVGRMAQGQRVLNCYAYTGGFSLAALAGGAGEVVSVESSAPALAMLGENLELNGLSAKPHQQVEGDVPEYLERCQSKGEQFDLIVLDPPAFVKHRAAMRTGLNGYRRLNQLAMRLLPPGGILVTASCSSHVTGEGWETVVFEAARAEGREAQVVGETFHAPDHPVHLQCREGRYLKCLFLRL